MDNKELEDVKVELKTLSINLEASIKDSKQRDSDLEIYCNDIADQLDTIRSNDLEHIKRNMDLSNENSPLYQKFQNLESKLSLIAKNNDRGLTIIGIMITIFGIIFTVIQLFG
jgi:predicted regulator of amino acid metabolism with ACT domain